MDRTLLEKVDCAFPVVWTGIDAGLRSASAGLATATLVVALCSAAPEGHAQTGSARASGQGAGALPAVVPAATVSVAQSDVSAGSADAPTALPPTVRSQRLRELDALLAVRGGAAPISARQADRAIAEAAARGALRDLERPQPFRKKSNDLFRTQRSLQVGNQEMLLRLRLRAKARNAMSVELRF